MNRGFYFVFILLIAAFILILNWINFSLKENGKHAIYKASYAKKYFIRHKYRVRDSAFDILRMHIKPFLIWLIIFNILLIITLLTTLSLATLVINTEVTNVENVSTTDKNLVILGEEAVNSNNQASSFTFGEKIGYSISYFILALVVICQMAWTLTYLLRTIINYKNISEWEIINKAFDFKEVNYEQIKKSPNFLRKSADFKIVKNKIAIAKFNNSTLLNDYSDGEVPNKEILHYWTIQDYDKVLVNGKKVNYDNILLRYNEIVQIMAPEVEDDLED